MAGGGRWPTPSSGASHEMVVCVSQPPRDFQTRFEIPLDISTAALRPWVRPEQGLPSSGSSQASLLSKARLSDNLEEERVLDGRAWMPVLLRLLFLQLSHRALQRLSVSASGPFCPPVVQMIGATHTSRLQEVITSSPEALRVALGVGLSLRDERVSRLHSSSTTTSTCALLR